MFVTFWTAQLYLIASLLLWFFEYGRGWLVTGLRRIL
jgi:hypothetical protein